MASIRKVNAKWLAEVRLKGLSKSKTFATKMQAQTWALGIEQQHGKHGGIVMGRTLADAMDKYALEVSPTKKGARWEQVRLNKLRQQELAGAQLTDLRPEDIQAWVTEQSRTLSPASINRELTLISSVLSVARKKWKWMQHEVTKDVDRPKAPPPRDKRLLPAEEAKILKALGYTLGEKPSTQRHELAIAMLIALETAMRQGELWKLDWQNVHLRERYVRLEDTKNGERRDVPLSSAAVGLFQLLGPQAAGPVLKHPQASGAVIFKRAVELAGIHDFHWHDLRHEAITRLARKLDVLDLARMIGHKDLRSLRIYYNPTPQEIAARLG